VESSWRRNIWSLGMSNLTATYGFEAIGDYELAVPWFLYTGGTAIMTNLRFGPFFLYVRVPDDNHLPFTPVATTPAMGHTRFPFGFVVPPDVHT